MSERPAEWTCTACGCTRGARPTSLAMWAASDRACGNHGCNCDEHAPYLGPAAQPPVRAMEADANGEPVRCVKCGGERVPGRGNRVCAPCWRSLAPGEFADLRDAWEKGDRNFPRTPGEGATPRKEEPPARPLMPGERCTRADTHPPGEHHHRRWRQSGEGGRCGYVEPSKASLPRYNLASGVELRYSNGHPRTALEAIRSRQAPEPWKPTIDDWDLLPDAGR